MNTSCAGYYGNSTVETPDCGLDGSALEPDMISWTYQTCTEWGKSLYLEYGKTYLTN